ncbi:MAG: hypothetical protein WKF75_08150 [Singulisphaera sp.]
MRVIGPIGLAFLLFPPAGPLERLGRLDHPAIREASGIVKSRRHPGIFWVHNDSGNPPALFAVTREGNLIREYSIAVPNVDWEDVAIDDDGHLYLGEIGNNDGRLPLRAIYRIDEPDPTRASATTLPVTKASFYRFPRDGRFDAEGLFIDRGRAIVVAKTFDGREAELFAIPLDPPAPLLRPALPEPVGQLPGFTEPATAADLSRDGRRLAVASARVARVYEREGPGGWKLLGTARYQADGIEALCWDGNDLILAGEGRGLYRVSERSWRAPTG